MPRASDVLDKLVYDEHNRLQFKPEKTLHVGNDKALVRMFHLGHYFPLPVGIHLIDNGQAKQLLYKPDFFTIPRDSPAKDLPNDIGFAGFRVMDPGSERDWLAFLGAAYMRSSGRTRSVRHVGACARNRCREPTPEEFPRFTDFYFGAFRNRRRADALLQAQQPARRWRACDGHLQERRRGDGHQGPLFRPRQHRSISASPL